MRAEDRTGHALLHTLYQNNLKAGTTFLNEWFAIDLVLNQDGEVCGLVALEIESGEVVFVKSRATVLATGGAGRIYATTTNALMNTGDGVGMALRAGFPVQDIEMWQFHPTGIHRAGVLVTEGCRGEGGYLVNKDGERFMERYAPTAKDLAGRDVVARSMILEIMDGRGAGEDADHVLLKLDHLGEDTLRKRLPGIIELSKTFAHVDPAREPIPVVPTCHYMMGGVPANIHGQALSSSSRMEPTAWSSGLYAIGEVACVSVHGANRLGGNSLLDLVVFGRAAGIHIEEAMRQGIDRRGPARGGCGPRHGSARALERIRSSGESVADLKRELQRLMLVNFNVFRNGENMRSSIGELAELRERIARAHPGGQEPCVQHGTAGSVGTGQPARGRRSDGDRGRGENREPRCPRAQRPYRTRRRQLAVPFDLFRVPTSASASGRSTSAPQTMEPFNPTAAELLSEAMQISLYRFDPDTDESPRSGQSRAGPARGP